MKKLRLNFIWCLVWPALGIFSGVAHGAIADDDRVTALEERLEHLEARLDQVTSRLDRLVPTGGLEPVAANPEERLNRAEEKLRTLESTRATGQPNANKSADPVRVSAGKDGFMVRSEDNDFQLKFSGYMQTDGRFQLGDSGASSVDTFLIRRARPILQGTVLKYVDFRLMPDFGDGRTVLQDAYVDFRYSPLLSFRVGKFKAPFGLERLQSATDLTFVERAFPTSLAPNRDVGVQVYGDFKGMSYALGGFNGTPDGGSVDLDADDSKDVVARLFVSPLQSLVPEDHFMRGLGAGIAFSSGRQTGSLSTYRSDSQVPIFSYSTGTMAFGTRRRLSPQFYYYHGPLGVLGEYVESKQEVGLGGVRSDISNEAWQLAVSYFLTGEKKGYRNPSPTQLFEPGTRGWGAWEVAARFSRLMIDPRAFELGFADPTKSVESAKAWTVGFNWYLNRNAKFVLDYEQTHFSRGAPEGRRPTEKGILSRLQLAF